MDSNLNSQALGVSDTISAAGCNNPADARPSVPQLEAALRTLQEEIVRVRATRDMQQLSELRSAIIAFQTNIALLRQEVDADPGPQVGDLVWGTLYLSWDKDSEWFDLYGKITNIAFGRVFVQFEHCDPRDTPSGAFEREARKYLLTEFQTHDTAMEWNEGDKEWTIDISPPTR